MEGHHHHHIEDTGISPLVALTLSEEECHKIQQPVIDLAMAKLHMDGETHATRRPIWINELHHGVGLTHLYNIQGAAKVSLLATSKTVRQSDASHEARHNIH